MLSAIGIIDHIDHIESGGIYFVLTHILGARIGATVGILYCFGQVRGVCSSSKKENRYCMEFIQFLMNGSISIGPRNFSGSTFLPKFSDISYV